MKASKLASALAAKFLQEGSFEAAGGPMSLQPMPAGTQGLVEVLDTGFSGLAVQAVGYAEGEPAAIDEPGTRDDEEQGQHPDEVHIYVSRGSKKFLSELPEMVEGIRICSHNIGRLYVRPHSSLTATHQGNVFERQGRLACGSSSAPSGKNYAGTFGALVRQGNGTMAALSNNHVFADCNHLAVGMPILGPAGRDGRPGQRPPGMFCQFANMIELRSGVPALVNPCREDIAIAIVPDESLVSSWQGDNGDGYDTPANIIAPSRQMPVKKFGRTTGLTRGRIEAAVVRTAIPYQSDHFNALVWYQDILVCRFARCRTLRLGGRFGKLGRN